MLYVRAHGNFPIIPHNLDYDFPSFLAFFLPYKSFYVLTFPCHTILLCYLLSAISSHLPPVFTAYFIHLCLFHASTFFPGRHCARLLVGLPGHPTEGVGLHQLLHLYVTPAGDTCILTAAQFRYTPAGFTRKCGSTPLF